LFEGVTAAVVLFLLFTLATLWLVLYQLVRQNGRVLLRLDAIERAVAAAGQTAVPAPRPERTEAASRGLAPGTPIDSFRLPDLAGREVALEDFRGKRVALVHWSPQCGFCDLIAPELAALEGDLERAKTKLVLVSYGDVESNRRYVEEHRLTAPVLVQDGRRVEAFSGLGTPVAYLLDEEGRVAKPIAIGANEVPELLREACAGVKKLKGERSVKQSRIERDGLKPGTRAPAFELPDVRSGRVSLDDFRGRKVLVVFTDPHCGPCDALAPELAAIAHAARGLQVVVVGRGELDENRRKADEHGFDCPYVLQDKWKLSKQYGIFATPVAFLIDKHGVIAREVAQGSTQILELARDAAEVAA
jgi:peroxiredoxin